MSKLKLIPAFEIGEGNDFIWKGERYTVLGDVWDFRDDSLTVNRHGNLGLFNKENFNPYCMVEKADA